MINDSSYSYPYRIELEMGRSSSPINVHDDDDDDGSDHENQNNEFTSSSCYGHDKDSSCCHEVNTNTNNHHNINGRIRCNTIDATTTSCTPFSKGQKNDILPTFEDSVKHFNRQQYNLVTPTPIHCQVTSVRSRSFSFSFSDTATTTTAPTNRKNQHSRSISHDEYSGPLSSSASYDHCHNHGNDFINIILPTTPSTCTTVSQTTTSHSSSICKFDRNEALSPFTPPPFTLANSSSSSEMGNSCEELLQPLSDDEFIKNLRQSFNVVRSNSSKSNESQHNKHDCNDHEYDEEDVVTICSEDSFVVTQQNDHSDKDIYDLDDDNHHMIYQDKHNNSNVNCSTCFVNNDFLLRLGTMFGNAFLRVRAPETVLDYDDQQDEEVKVDLETLIDYDKQETHNQYHKVKGDDKTPKRSTRKRIIKREDDESKTSHHQNDTLQESTTQLVSNLIKPAQQFSPPLLPDLATLSRDKLSSFAKPSTTKISPRGLYQEYLADLTVLSPPPHPLKYPKNVTGLEVNSEDDDTITLSLSSPGHHNQNSATTFSTFSSPNHHLIDSTSTLSSFISSSIKMVQPADTNAPSIQLHPLIAPQLVHQDTGHQERIMMNDSAIPKKHNDRAKLDSFTTTSSSSPRHHLITSTMATFDFDIESEWIQEASKCEEDGDYTRALYCYGLCLNSYCRNRDDNEQITASSDKQQKIISLLHKIGIVQWKIGSYDLSLEALEDAFLRAQRLVNDNIYNKDQQDSYLYDIQLKEDLAEILNSLGKTHVSQGSYDKAMKCHEESLSILKSTCTMDSDASASQSECIDIKINDETSLIPEADLMKELKTSVDGTSHCSNDYSTCPDDIHDKSTFQMLHPNIARTLICIGNVHLLMGNYLMADARFRDGYYIQKNTVGPDHVDVGETLNALGSIYEKRGDYVKAMRCYKKAHQIYVNQLGEIHVDVAVTLNYIGQVYHILERHTKAMNAYNESLKIMRQLLGEGHRNLQVVLFNKGLVYVSCEQYHKALKIFKEILAAQRAALGGNHVDVAATLQSLGDVNEKLGKYEKAINFTYKALRIQRKTLGRSHLRVALTLDRLGQLNLAYRVDLDEAICRFREALKQYHLNSVSEDDPLIVRVLQNMDLATKLRKECRA